MRPPRQYPPEGHGPGPARPTEVTARGVALVIVALALALGAVFYPGATTAVLALAFVAHRGVAVARHQRRVRRREGRARRLCVPATSLCVEA